VEGSGPCWQPSFACKSLQAVACPSYGGECQPTLKRPVVPLSVRAEITGARLGSCTMMIAPVMIASRYPATRPSESLRTVLVEPLQIPLELSLERLLEVIALVKPARAKADLFLLAHPSNQLQLPFVFCAVSAFAVLIIPVPAEFPVRRPILPLTINPSRITRRQRRYNDLDD